MRPLPAQRRTILAALGSALLLSACPDHPTATAAAGFEPALLDLGLVTAVEEDSPAGLLVLRNTGDLPLFLLAVAAAGQPDAWAVQSPEGGLLTARIEPGGDVEVEVRFEGTPAPGADDVLRARIEVLGGDEGVSELVVEAPIHLGFDCDADSDGVVAEVCGGLDCADMDPTRHGGAPELCNGLDEDCDGLPLSDEVDADGDGYLACAECDDQDASIHPGAPELCNGVDDDCDASTSADGGELDADGDGSLSCADCDDDAPWNSPGGVEFCDGLDNDCDGEVLPDEVDADADGHLACAECNDADPTSWPGAPELCDGLDNDCDGDAPDEADGDLDGHLSCADCDDLAATTFPGAPELCNGIDDDCDGAPEAGEVDLDGDGFLACAECDDSRGDFFPGAAEACDGLDGDCDGAPLPDEVDSDGDGFLACAECDDAAPAVFPGATEACNAVDDDCDGAPLPDEVDVDGDGYLGCAECDDGDDEVFPGASERCNGVDDDCDGTPLPDEVDGDGDGALACADCDDADELTWPSAPELCDGVDNDCDGAPQADEVDGDADGWLACADCDDGDPAINPDEPDVCDGVDNDCAGVLDDLDGDGWDCTVDCDDFNGSVWVATDELCNGLDDDCDGDVDNGTLRVPEDYPYIQWALDASRNGAGSVVCVGPGIWPGRLAVLSDVELIGWAGSDVTWLTGDTTIDPALAIQDLASEVYVQGFTIATSHFAVRVIETDATFVDLVVRDLTPTPSGIYGVQLVDSTADFTDLKLLDNDMGTHDLFRVEGSNVTIEDLEMAGNVGGFRLLGYLNEPNGDSLSVNGCDVSGNEGSSPGGLFAGSGEYAFADCEFIDNGGSAIASAGELTITDSTFDNIDYYAIANNGGDVVIERVRVTASGVSLTWQQDLAAISLSGAAAEAVIRNTVVAGNPEGGIRLAGRTVFIENTTIIGTTSSTRPGFRAHTSDVVITNSMVAGNEIGVSSYNSTVTFDHSNVWGNTTDWFGLPDPTGTNGNISVDPQHLGTTSSDPLDWDLHLSASSPLVDAGSPALLDPDGSPSDIGAWGGPDADLWDLDGDGYPSWWQPGPYDYATYPAQGWDCDDLDPDVVPGDGC